jgi:hypothetical protein
MRRPRPSVPAGARSVTCRPPRHAAAAPFADRPLSRLALLGLWRAVHLRAVGRGLGFRDQPSERNSLLGWVALVLVGLAVSWRWPWRCAKLAGFARMGQRSTRLRLARPRPQLAARRHQGRPAASSPGWCALYANRPEWPRRGRLAARGAEVFDADGLWAGRAELLAPLDQAARREVEAAARQVATVTALVPLALADVATALALRQPAHDPPHRRDLRRAVGHAGQLRLMRGC